MLNERVRWAIVSGICLTLVLLASGRAAAQSAIAGTVKDASGAVMPGVTVEAAAPC